MALSDKEMMQALLDGKVLYCSSSNLFLSLGSSGNVRYEHPDGKVPVAVPGMFSSLCEEVPATVTIFGRKVIAPVAAKDLRADANYFELEARGDITLRDGAELVKEAQQNACTGNYFRTSEQAYAFREAWMQGCAKLAQAAPLVAGDEIEITVNKLYLW